MAQATFIKPGETYGYVPKPGESRWNAFWNTLAHEWGSGVNASIDMTPGVPSARAGVNWLNAPAVGPKAIVTTSKAGAIPELDFGSYSAAPKAQPAKSGQVDYAALAKSLAPVFMAQESNNTPGAVGQPTKYGTALGSMQVLPDTAKGLAKKYGFTYDEAKMKGKDATSANYQQMVGTYALQDALEMSKGDLGGAARIYFAGPDTKLHGPKTAQYEKDILGRVQALPGNPFQMPGLSFVDPTGAMAMYGQAAPQAIPGMTLPDAPQRGMPTPLADHEAPTTEGLDALARQFMPKARDKSGDGNNKLMAFLSNAAQAASQLGPNASAGQIILAAGGGGAGGLRQAKQQIEAADNANDEMIRQFGLSMGFRKEEIKQIQLGVRNANKDRHVQNANQIAETMFQNAQTKFNRDVAQAQSDQQTQATNIGAGNQFRQNQVRVGLDATSAAAQTQNQAVLGQNQLDRQAWSQENDPTKRTTSIVSSMGVDPSLASKDPIVANAVSGAAAIGAKNIDGAKMALVKEALLSGDFSGEFGEDVEKEIVKRLTQGKGGKPDLDGALTIAMTAINSTPVQERNKAYKALAEKMAKNGKPVAFVLNQFWAGK